MFRKKCPAFITQKKVHAAECSAAVFQNYSSTWCSAAIGWTDCYGLDFSSDRCLLREKPQSRSSIQISSIHFGIRHSMPRLGEIVGHMHKDFGRSMVGIAALQTNGVA